MRILLVEDEHRIANIIKKGLELERFAVDVSYSGTDGYDLASSEEYDLIILDRMLPGTDGLKICRNLRKDGIHTPILMLTAKGEVSDRVEGLNAGADDYLPKPFSFAELLARIRALSRRPKNILAETLVAGDLRLNSKTFEAERGSRRIFLSHKEYALLEYLMRHTGQTITKDQIIAHVWDYDADILPNTLEVTIKNLRSKIENPFPGKKTLIKTVRGFGYRIGGE